MKVIVALLLIASMLVASSPVVCKAASCEEASKPETCCASSCGGGHCSPQPEEPKKKNEAPDAPQPCIPFMRCCCCTVPQPVEPLRMVVLLDRRDLPFAPLSTELLMPLTDEIWHPPNGMSALA